MTETASEAVELTITRIFDAPRELVFRCMLEPEHLTHFWGPTGVSTPIDKITIDPRPGGAFDTVMVNDATGEEYATHGVFVEIVEPERIVWTEPNMGITNASTFVDLGDGRTEVRILQSNLPVEFTSDEAQAGFQSSLDRFAAYLTTL
jgi:uncharacterized protein YndB with AHSA1/START domain